jgi:uncharacterized protein YcbK (DUF882 family)
MISRHFERKEFACKGNGCDCGGRFAAVDVELVEVLERVREKFGPVFINSACRCPSHNRKVGGKPHSYHVRGMAADIRSPAATPEEIFGFLDSAYPDRFGLIKYVSFVHVDVRRTPFRKSH